MEKFYPRLNKLILETGADEAIGGAMIAKSDAKSEEKLGLIFSIIDIRGVDDFFCENFIEIINDLKTEYYLPPIEAEYGVEKRFEECLQRANRRIHKLIAQSINVIDLRGINALIGLVYRNRIYLSHSGKMGAYLFHKKVKGDFATVDIIGPNAGRIKPDQEKIFGNIVSGEITTKDNLFFCNSVLLQYFSASNLCRIVGENQLFEAMDLIRNRLEDREARDKFYAVVSQLQVFEDIPSASEIISSNKASELHAKPEKSINNLINTQQKTEKYLTPSTLPNWQKFLLLLARGLKTLITWIIKYGWIGAQKAAEGIIFGSKFIAQKISAYFEKRKKRQTLLAGVTETKVSLDEDKDGEQILTIKKETVAIISEEPLPKTENVQETKQQAEPKKDRKEIAEQYTRTTTSEINRHGIKPQVSHWLNKQIGGFISLNIWQKILVVSAFVLFFFFSQSIVLNSQKTSRDVNINDVQTIVKQANEYLNKAEAQNIFNDETGAKSSIASATTEMAKIPAKKQYESDIQAIQKRIDDLNHSLEKVTYLDNPAVIADLGNTSAQAQAVGLAKIGTQLFSFDNQNHQLDIIDQAKKQTITVPVDPSIGQVRKVVTMSDKSIALLNDKNEIYQYALGASTTKSLAVGANVKDIESYGGKLYILQDNKVTKNIATKDGFNSGSSWIKGNPDLTKSISIAVGDGVYLGQTNGQISFYNSGSLANFKVSTINPVLSSPAQIYTNLDSLYVYVLDPQNQRVVIFDKQGNLKTQYTSKLFTGLKSMALSERDKKIYVLSDNKVYAIDITF